MLVGPNIPDPSALDQLWVASHISPQSAQDLPKPSPSYRHQSRVKRGETPPPFTAKALLMGTHVRPPVRCGSEAAASPAKAGEVLPTHPSLARQAHAHSHF